VRVAAAEEACAKVSLPRLEDKSFRCQARFRAWRAEIDGEAGRAGAPVAYQQLWCLALRLVRDGWVTKLIMQNVLGLFVPALQFRRELFSLFHRTFAWTAILVDGTVVRLPADVADEIRAAGLQLPV
jgi:hypothetical protein